MCCIFSHLALWRYGVPPPPAGLSLQVSSMATELRHRYNGQVAVVDDGTEHPHRLSLTMRPDIADRVTNKWSEGLQQSGVKVRRPSFTLLHTF